MEANTSTTTGSSYGNGEGANDLSCEIMLGCWRDYFDQHEMIATERGLFSVYLSGIQPDAEQIIVVAHHGAGFSAQSFACLAAECRHLEPGVGFVAIDARGHGATERGEYQANGSLCRSVFVEDLVALLAVLPQQLQWTVPHPTCLVGHSLGGSVVTAAARNLPANQLDHGLPLLGVVLVDIVEETALRALHQTRLHLRARPPRFRSREDAVRWSLQSRLLRNQHSASISIPDRLMVSSDGGWWVWRTDLLGEESNWADWFRGLSAEFVALSCARLLCLAEREEHADTTLMIAAMQGKFQTAIIRGCGHAVHEDQPAELAKILISFIRRHVFSIQAKETVKDLSDASFASPSSLKAEPKVQIEILR